jgi:hypothetical protein
MSKSKSKRVIKQAEKLSKNTGSKRRMLLLTASLIFLIMTGGALAQWTSIFSATQQNQSKVAEIEPSNFDPLVGPAAKEYIYIGGKPVATEEPPGVCTVSLLKSSQSFAANGGSGSVTVAAGTGCGWTAVSNAPWLSINSGSSSGTGPGTVQYTVTANTNPIRNGTLTIGGNTFTVYQGLEFSDVPIGANFYNEISRLSSRSVTLGCQGPPNPYSYCPTQTVLRDQMAAFIIRALGEFSPPTPPTQRFNDVPTNHPFYNFIDRMAVLQITLGCQASPPLYCPGSTVTHQEMAAFIIRALGMPNPPTPATQRFSDVAPSHPFYAFIDQMYERGIWTGCPGSNTYCPTSLVTREQMAAILVRAFNL